MIPELRRIFRIGEFIRRELPLTETRVRSSSRIAEAAGEFDVLISGSDQIWCWGKPWTYRMYDPTFFLAFGGRSVRRIAYAPSCGGMGSFGPHADEVSLLLSRYETLSARDENTQRLIREATGRVCALVLDPTFLHDFSQPETESDTGELTSPYLVSCGAFGYADRLELRKAAHALGLRYVSMASHDPVADECILDPGPIAWLSVVRNASFVMTNLFHGVSFAIQFHKPFFAISSGHSGMKITDLLRGLGLAHRCADRAITETLVGLASELGDLDDAAARLRLARRESLRFLRVSLGGNAANDDRVDAGQPDSPVVVRPDGRASASPNQSN
jgi:hypothetical protein